MKSTGRIFKSRDYRTIVEPPATVLEDESRFGNDGTFFAAGKPDWVRLPSGLWVMSFDGADYVSIPPAAITNSFTQLTVSLWVKLTSITTTYILFSANKDAADDIRLSAGNTSQLFAALDDGVAGFPETVAVAHGYSADTWHKIDFTYDNTILRLYSDAVELANDTAGFTWYNPLKIYFGGRTIGGLNGLDGGIALPRIHSRVLSPGKILQTYEAERRWFGG